MTNHTKEHSTVKVTFASISICFDGQRWLLMQDSGEAMEIGVKKMEKLLQDYYEGNFS